MDDLDLGATIKGFIPGQKVFNRYKLTKILGRGGMGVVWLARDEKLERDIALKFLPEVVAADPRAVDELKRETRRSLELTHPHIVRIYDFVEDARTAAIAMEYIPGATLAKLALDQPQRAFDPEALTAWVRQLCEALDYAHRKAKVVHRDLKPANLMIDGAGELKVADFGIAASVSDSVSRVSQQGGTSGTPVYMSPQQMMGEKPAVTDDIYALGATLYDLLTGKPPFYTGNIILQVQSKVPPLVAARRADLDVRNTNIPTEWEATIAACLAKEAKDRPQSAGEVAECLGLSAKHAKSTKSEMVEPDRHSTATNQSKIETPHSPKQDKKSKMPALVGLAIGVILIVVFGLNYLVRDLEQQRRLDPGREWAEQRRIAEGGMRAEQERAREEAEAEAARVAAVEEEAERQRAEAEAEIRRLERIAAEAAHPWRMIETQLRSGKPLWEDPYVADDTDVRKEFDLLTIAKASALELAGRYLEKHPRMIAALENYERIATRIAFSAGEVADQARMDFGQKFNSGVAPIWGDLNPTSASVLMADLHEAITRQQQSALLLESKSDAVMSPSPTAGQPWENSLGMKFVPVPGANVLFSIWETRVQDFEAFVKETGHNATAGMYSDRGNGWRLQGDTWKSPGFPQGPLHPVVGVNQADAQAFCRWLTAKERREGRLGIDQEYRLPTDAEWDAAVGKEEFPWGNQWPPPPQAGNYADEAANSGRYKSWSIIAGYNDGYDTTAPVGSFAPNRHGIFDLGGNVWEYVNDRPHGLRGASSFTYIRDSLASSFRFTDADRGIVVGFRVVVAVGSALQQSPRETVVLENQASLKTERQEFLPGIFVTALDESLRRQHGLPPNENTGLLIVSASGRYVQYFTVGTLLKEVNRVPVVDVDGAKQNLRPGRNLAMLWVKGSIRYVMFQVDDASL